MSARGAPNLYQSTHDSMKKSKTPTFIRRALFLSETQRQEWKHVSHIDSFNLRDFFRCHVWYGPRIKSDSMFTVQY